LLGHYRDADQRHRVRLHAVVAVARVAADGWQLFDIEGGQLSVPSVAPAIGRADRQRLILNQIERERVRLF
jgi:hypothetical protein